MFFAILLSLIHYISESNEFRYKKKTILFDNYIKNFMEDDYQTRDFKFTYVIVFIFVVVIATIFLVYFIFFLYKKCSKKDSEQIDNDNASPLLKANNDMYCEAIPPIVENPNYCQQQPQTYCQQQSYAIPTDQIMQQSNNQMLQPPYQPPYYIMLMPQINQVTPALNNNTI